MSKMSICPPYRHDVTAVLAWVDRLHSWLGLHSWNRLGPLHLWWMLMLSRQGEICRLGLLRHLCLRLLLGSQMEVGRLQAGWARGGRITRRMDETTLSLRIWVTFATLCSRGTPRTTEARMRVRGCGNAHLHAVAPTFDESLIAQASCGTQCRCELITSRGAFGSAEGAAARALPRLRFAIARVQQWLALSAYHAASDIMYKGWHRRVYSWVNEAMHSSRPVAVCRAVIGPLLPQN
jgi:hypothetical protein